MIKSGSGDLHNYFLLKVIRSVTFLHRSPEVLLAVMGAAVHPWAAAAEAHYFCTSPHPVDDKHLFVSKPLLPFKPQASPSFSHHSWQAPALFQASVIARSF